MAPKSKRRNPFYYFMREMKDKEAAKGHNISMHDLPNLAHPLWKKLSVAEREPYEEMARRFNNDPNLRGGKLASDGTRVEDNLREMEEKVYLVNKMKQDIKRFCNTDCTDEEEFKETAPKKLFYFLTFNILCHTEDDTYIPIEVGLIEYSIQCGIHKEYTKILYPGRPPTGYAGAAKIQSDDKHQIDIFGEKGSERNMRTVYNDIKKFTNPVLMDEYPPVFCEESHIEITKGCLNWLARVSGEENVFEVWNAAYLLMELRAGVGQPLPSEVIATDLLNKTSFNYHPSTRCEFHEERDNHFCALTYSKCLCYLLSDAICNLFDVTLTERHIPNRAVEDKAYSVTVFKEPAQRNQPSYVSSFRLDKSENYYQNVIDDENFPSLNTRREPVVPKPRQPASTCTLEKMSRLNLNITSATVPGHGIGRGLPRKQ